MIMKSAVPNITHGFSDEPRIVSHPFRAPRLRAAHVIALAIGYFAATVPAHALTEGDSSLEEIVVTAQKRSQNAEDVGITLTAISSQDLKEAGITKATDIALIAPGVNIAGSFGGQVTTFAIRGVVQQDFNQQSESPVGTYVDEGYIASNNASGIGLFDVDHIEVLKGPQGTLFGRNATGGVISIVTKAPTDTFTVDTSASWGSFDEKRFEGAISGPLTDKLQARLAVLYDQNGGYIENSSPTGGSLGGQDTIAVRVRLAFEPTDNLSFLLTGYNSNTTQSWGPYFLLSTRATCTQANGTLHISNNGNPTPGNACTGTGNIPGSIVVSAPAPFLSGYGEGSPQPASDAADWRVDANHAQSTGGSNLMNGGTLKTQWNLGASQLTSITSYSNSASHVLLDDDASELSFLDTDTSAQVRNASEELRNYMTGDWYRWTTGIYYLHIDAQVVAVQSVGVDGADLVGGSPLQFQNPFEETTNSYSAFTQAEFDIAPKWTLVSGLRYTKEDKSFHFFTNIESPDGAFLESGRTFPDAGSPPGTLNENLYSGKIQLEYRPIKDVLLYGGVNRGTKAGGFNAPFIGGAIPADSMVPYKPEVLVDYEVGAKTEFLDRRVQVNGALFYYDYQNYQGFEFYDLATVISNYKASDKGGELDVEARPTNEWTLRIGASYVDSIVDNVLAGNSMLPLGNSTENPSNTYLFATRRAPYTSPWTGFSTARYEFPLAGGHASVQGNLTYTGDFYQNLTNFDSTRVGSYVLYGARIGWTNSDGKWDFSVTGKNLGNKLYRTVGFDLSDFGGATQTAYGPPRWFLGTVAYKF
jgi:iron complex outermembrane recepter protein